MMISINSFRVTNPCRVFCSAIWKPCVVDFLGINSPDLEVSSLGNVRRVRTGHVMKGFKHSNGLYIGVSLRRTCGKRINFSLHRLVCAVFNGPPQHADQIYVHHINHDGHDNRAINLQWVTPKENLQSVYDRGTQFPNKLVPVIQTTIDGSFVQEFSSVKEAALALQCKQNQLSKALTKQAKFKGYYWERKLPKSINFIENEYWQVISGNENYAVSSLGRIQNIKKKILLRPSGTYDFVRLNGKYLRVHRLVASEFVDNIHGHRFVDHIDGDKKNNQGRNLRWVDSVENRRNPNTYQKHCKPVIQFTLEGSFIATFSSLSEATRITGAPQTHISKCCNGKARSASGYIWKFKE